VFGECYAPFTLKTPFLDFEKEYVHCSRWRLNVLPLPNLSVYCSRCRLHVLPLPILSIRFQWQSNKVVAQCVPFLFVSVYLFYIALVLNWICMNHFPQEVKQQTNNQSILSTYSDSVSVFYVIYRNYLVILQSQLHHYFC
jgi:hypothetical protein